MGFSKLKKSTLYIFYLLFLFELVSFFASKLELLTFNNDPVYTFSSVPEYIGFAWRNEKSEWGAWHKVNSTDTHISDCFDISYQSNNVGARDSSDYGDSIAQNSYILIGDSFAEGLGVSLDQIFPKFIENETGRRVLNFGSAGNFGPVQEYLIYDKLASNYPHAHVIYFFLPSNDFVDNDFAYYENIPATNHRYRPYFRKAQNDSYDYFYPKESIKSEDYGTLSSYHNLGELPFVLRLKNILVRFTYSSNTLWTIKLALSDPKEKNSTRYNMDGTNGYFFADKSSIDGSLHFVEKLFKRIPEHTKVTLMIIPERNDIEHVKNGRVYKNSYWFTKIKAIAENSNVNLIDLMDHLPEENWKNIFLSCDSHWSSMGHKWAGKIFLEGNSY